MTEVYLTSAYLAPVEYYAHMLAADKVWVEQYDHYMKQTYRNRCIIAGPSGRIDLTVPTVNMAIGATCISMRWNRLTVTHRTSSITVMTLFHSTKSDMSF